MKIKLVSMLIVAIAAAVAFTATGCGKTDTAKNGGALSSEKIESGLKELVGDGTITTAQADKIKDYLETQMQNGGNFHRRGGSRPAWSGSRPQGSFSRPAFSASRGQRFSRGDGMLSQLVSDGVITQEQAQKVVEKLFGTMRGGGGQGGYGQQAPNGAQQPGAAE